MLVILVRKDLSKQRHCRPPDLAIILTLLVKLRGILAKLSAKADSFLNSESQRMEGKP